MKLDKFVVDRRVKLMEAEGIRFLTNTEIGKHVSAEFLLKVSCGSVKFKYKSLYHLILCEVFVVGFFWR